MRISLMQILLLAVLLVLVSPISGGSLLDPFNPPPASAADPSPDASEIHGELELAIGIVVQPGDVSTHLHYGPGTLKPRLADQRLFRPPA